MPKRSIYTVYFKLGQEIPYYRYFYNSIFAQQIFSIVGIAVSIGLFLLGYHQTILAKKENTRSANDEIEKITILSVSKVHWGC